MKWLLLLCLASTGLACSGHYAQSMRNVHQLAREGRPDEAHQALKTQTDGTDWDALLVALDEGALLHRAGQWQQSADALNRAIAMANDRETVRLSEELFGRAPFRMAKHEKQALHALQAINYLQLGKIDDAVVEARLTDLRQGKLSREAEASAADEQFITGNTVDEKQRAFFEQLVFGRYISAVAWELEGRTDEAFIDYFRAYELAKRVPADARVSSAVMGPGLLRLARQLERPETAALEKEISEAEPPLDKEGELLVVVEAGFGPELSLTDRAGYSLSAIPRTAAPGYLVANGQPHVPEPMSSLEELALRRSYTGLLIDRERSASVGVNTALFFSYFLLFPVAMPLLIKRGWESGIRMGQSWFTLPAEFQLARVRLPAGKHTVRVPSPQGLVARDVHIRPGKLTVVVAFAH